MALGAFGEFLDPVGRHTVGRPGTDCRRGWLCGSARRGPGTVCKVVKSQNQSSPGSNDCMTACPVAAKCAVAWRLRESSQHPMWPHDAQRLRWTHQEPEASHSTHPFPEGGTEASIMFSGFVM